MAYNVSKLANQAPLLNNLICYLRSDTGVTYDGSNNVTAWADQSGAGIIPSYVSDASYTKPVFVASGGPNNAPYLAFTAAGLVSTTQLLAPGSARTIFVVGKAADLNGGCLFTNKRGGGAIASYSLQRSSEQQYFYSDGQLAANTIAANNTKAGNVLRADLTQPFIACFDTNGTGDLLGVRLNGKACATNGAPVVIETGTTNGVVLGNRENPAFAAGWSGQIVCYLVYSRVLSLAESQAVHAFLSSLYAIPVSVEETMQLQTLNVWPGSPKVGTGNAQIKVYLPSSTIGTPGRRPCMIYTPGGGYAVVDETMGRDMCAWAASLGIVGIVLKYRLPDGGLTFPGSVCVDDLLRTVRLARSGAEKGVTTSATWGVDSERIIVAGESAGGHLASCAATHGDDGNSGSGDLVEQCSSKANLSILLCPVMNMDDGTISYGGGVSRFIGASGANTFWSNEKQVTASTPPALICWADDDATVDPKNSQRYLDALTAKGVKNADFVQFATGNHGIGFPGSQQYIDFKKAAWTWMQSTLVAETGLFRYGRQVDQKPGQKLFGRVSLNVVALADASHNVTLTRAQASAGILEFTGVLPANTVVIFPANEDGGEVALANITSGSFTLTVKVTGQTGFVLEQTGRCKAYFNGTDIVRVGSAAVGGSNSTSTPTLLSGASNYGGGFQTTSYTKTPDGYVHLDGLLNGVTANTVIFTLPVGFRPPGQVMLAGVGSQGGVVVTGRIDVLTTGDVQVKFPAGDFVSISGLSFTT